MICNKCGKENNNSSKFCMWCGESLQTTVELNSNTDSVIVQEKTNNIEVNNNEPSEKKNKGKGLVVALVIVLLLIVGISGFLLGRYSIDKKEASNNDVVEEKEDTSNDGVLEENDLSNISDGYIPNCLDDLRKKTTLITDIDETKYNNISEYIHQQNNVKINWEYCVLVQDGDYTTFDKPKYELTETEKNVVLEEIKNSTYNIQTNGIGGACMSKFEIMYERNNKQYFVNYTPVGAPRQYVMSSNDGNIYKILDKTVTNTLEDPVNCLYAFDNLSSTADSLLEQLQGY